MTIYKLPNIAQNLPIEIKNALMQDEFGRVKREVEHLYPRGDSMDGNMDRLLFVACNMDPPISLPPRLARLPLQYASLAIEKGADIKGERKMMIDAPLISVARHEKVDLIDLLIDRGADVDGLSETYNTTALYVALASNKSLSVQRLLSRGANPNVGDTPAWFATFYKGDFEGFLDLVFEHGADITAKTKKGMNACHYWLRATNDEENAEFHSKMIDALVHKGIDLKELDGEGFTALEYCSQHSLKVAHEAISKHIAYLDAAALDQATPYSRPANHAQRL